MKKIFICVIMVLAIANISWAQDTGSLWESFLKGEYQNVIQQTDELTRRVPGKKINAGIYYLRGTSFLQMGQASAARRNFNLLLTYWPASEFSGLAQLSLGDCLLIERNLEEAGKIFKDFADKNNNSPLLSLACFKLAEVKRKAGLWDEARALHLRVKEKFPNSLESNLSADILSRDEFYFTLQVGSFINRESANELTRKLNESGFPAYMAELVKLGQVFYRVRVGKFLNRKEATKAFNKLVEAGYSPHIYP